jgi:hypothetical protein
MLARWSSLLVALCLYGAALAQDPPKNPPPDPFPREGKPAQRVKKDALEGKAPPALAVTAWRNTNGPLALADLRGKVVLLDFWGVW